MTRALLGLLAVAALTCNAQTRPAGPCPALGFDAATGGNPDLAEVATTAPATAWIGCNSPNDCMREAIEPGSPVLVYTVHGEWTCGYAQDNHGGGPSWLRSANLRAIHYRSNPPLAAWLGTWTGGGDRVHIARNHEGGLRVQGHGVWHGRAGVEHFGDIGGDALPNGARLHLQDGACTVDLTLAGDLIVANDNNQCGGMNVRFWGFWRRAGSR